MEDLPIQMVDLKGQYLGMKQEIDDAISAVINSSAFIKGNFVETFEEELATFLDVKHVIGVGNGTDAIQIALMALGVGPGDEVIAPSFTFVATSEAASLLGAVPVFADIDPSTFNLDPSHVEHLISDKTKAIIPVHLYGQPCDMEPIMELANRNGIAVIEDNAQGIGARYGSNYTGSLGDLGTLSFFPSKNLGCFGDGGAITTNSTRLAEKSRLISNHGSKKKYHNEVVGINSRLDGLQAAILSAKLKRLEEFNGARRRAADLYDAQFANCELIQTPDRASGRTHVFHQYTIRILHDGPSVRNQLSTELKADGIPHAIYYPIPVHALPVNTSGMHPNRHGDMTHTNVAADQVISLPMHTELDISQIKRIASRVIRAVTELSTVAP